MEKKEQMELILSDVLDELNFDCESNREKGVGITSEEYVLTQLQKLWDLIRDDYISDETLEELNRQKNNLNRKISTLKKANLKEKCKDCNSIFTKDDMYKELGYCENCMFTFEDEYKKGTEPYVILQNTKYDKKGDVVFLTPNLERTKELILRKIITPKN